jgi:tetratricopeptide (TPR) repeat protein/O-antigen ligase
MALLLGVSYVVSRFSIDENKSHRIFLTIFCSLFLVVSIELIGLVSRAVFGLSGSISSHIFGLVGKWNDLGLYAFFVLVVSVTSLYRFSLGIVGKWIGYIAVVVSILILSVVNLLIGWYAIAILSLLGIIFEGVTKKKNPSNTKAFKILFIIGLLVSLVYIADSSFAVFDGKVSNFTSKILNVSSNEVYPSVSSTYGIAKSVIAENPLFGFGPGRFADAWRIYRTQSVNESQFWNTNFSYGVGLWPTFAVTTGILGLIAVLALVLTLIFVSVKVYRNAKALPLVSAYVHETTAILVGIFTIAFFMYAPGFAGMIVYTALIGLLLGCSAQNPGFKKISIPFFSHVFYVKIIVIIISIAIMCGGLWVYAQKTVASYYYGKALSGSLDTIPQMELVASNIKKAIAHDPRDFYARSLTTVIYREFNMLITATSTPAGFDAQKSIDLLAATADGSIGLNPYNSENYIFSGELFRALDSIGIPGASEAAGKRYVTAKLYDPHNPSIPLLEARLALQKKDNTEALLSLKASIAKKPNYTEAVFLLSQLLISMGDGAEAMKQIEARAHMAPAEPIVFFQLGFMKYSVKDYKGASEALEFAATLAPDYSNALYFLGLSYYELGRSSDALAIFNHIQNLNPGNTDIETIISRLKAGKSPIAPAEAAPEKNKKLPIDEKNSAKAEQ